MNPSVAPQCALGDRAWALVINLKVSYHQLLLFCPPLLPPPCLFHLLPRKVCCPVSDPIRSTDQGAALGQAVISCFLAPPGSLEQRLTK